ncbi:MAG TPA: succinate--CoA ligase subunit beta [Bacillota bacterium]|nr:succinate--CoA ligase subunit beta [Bacillota bacterium]HPL53052.1 succinate--CoA ligase subunit beta [Bacillota bacterium]
MNLYEFEGKRILSDFGIPVPKSEMIYAKDADAPLTYPFVLKAQVLTGGRGKAGGIRVCANEAEFKKNAAEILDMTIKGHRVNGLLCEQMVKAERELYLSITLQGVDRPTLIISEAGGMEIEEVAKTNPDKIIKMEIDPFTGLKDYQLNSLAKLLGYPDVQDLIALIKKVQKAFFDTKALLVEINPLGVVDGKLLAMDSKFVLDDNARNMRNKIEAIEEERKKLANVLAVEKEKTTITFVPLGSGEIGLISDGAGTGMLTLDLIYDGGGKVASFCELGGTTSAEVMYRAMKLTMESGFPIKSILVVLIGGFNRMDDMANGITGYIKDHKLDIPIFTRMCGTMEEEGKRIMAEAGLATYYDLTETVNQCIKASLEVK